jgi:hypothetical protein
MYIMYFDLIHSLFYFLTPSPSSPLFLQLLFLLSVGGHPDKMEQRELVSGLLLYTQGREEQQRRK